MIEGCRQRIEVARWAGAGPLYLLKRGILRRIANGTDRALAGRGKGRDVCCTFGKAKIKQHNGPFRGKFQILWLDVTVNNRRILLVQIVERMEYLLPPLKHLFQGKRLTLLNEEIGQVVALDEIHYKKLPII